MSERPTPRQTEILRLVNGGLHRSPPLDRKTLDILQRKGLVKVGRHRRYGYQCWNVTDEGKEFVS
jgi:hypothetical protein